ncbi:MAG: tail fiber domain-containing protein [Chitinophagales bacterium]|nr:tail fiber domain-containing protein [Chitinophagales bacterium]
MFALMLNSFCLQALGTFKILSSGHAHIGYNASPPGLGYSSLAFGNNGKSVNNGAWQIHHWDYGLHFYVPCPANNCQIYNFALMDNGQIGLGMKPLINQGSFITLNGRQVPYWVSKQFQTQSTGFIVTAGHYSWSDSTLKENIELVDTNALMKILALNPLKYTFKANAKLGFETPVLDSTANYDSTHQTNCINQGDLLHFGFTAQQLERVFPNLVFPLENVKVVNYTELIPILVKGIQEQQKEILDLKAEILLIKNLTPTTTTKSIIYQNEPNPFDANTTFKYYIDETISVTNCSIEVRDLTGILKATIPLADQSGLGQTSYSFTSLNPGFYVYTLKVNGTAKDSKMMLIER